VSSDLFTGNEWEPLSLHKYAYARLNPSNLVDPSGYDTQVIITTDPDSWTGIAGHAAVRVDNGGRGEPVLFDPGGSYDYMAKDDEGAIYRPSNGAFIGEEADLEPFMRYQISAGEVSAVFWVRTTPEEERQIAMNFGYGDEGGGSDVMGGFCAITVSANIEDIGPFKGIGRHGRPVSLGEALRPVAYRRDVYNEHRAPPGFWENTGTFLRFMHGPMGGYGYVSPGLGVYVGL
jgi:hypothetical protein